MQFDLMARPFGESRTTLSNTPPQWARREEVLLAPCAMFSMRSAGRKYPEPPHAYRSPFQRDRDRILHSAAFRRLSGKMQVFTGDMGDYHRTRLTHTHEVATIARTIGRVLRLNEDLIEALALLHDIGHPPFGHSGEETLCECLGSIKGFSHNQFALTLVEELESRYTAYPGLNLSKETLDGQDFRITHEGKTPLLEVQVVDLADSIAYNAHDADDALKLGLMQIDQLRSLELVDRALRWMPGSSMAATQLAQRQMLVHHLIDVQVADLLLQIGEQWPGMDQLDSHRAQELGVLLQFSPPMAAQRQIFSSFLFENVYRHPQLVAIRKQASRKVRELFGRLTESPDLLPDRFRVRADEHGLARSACEYIAGMTDRFCDQQFHRLIELREIQAVDWQ